MKTSLFVTLSCCLMLTGCYVARSQDTTINIPVPTTSFLLDSSPVVETLNISPSQLQGMASQNYNEGTFLLNFTISGLFLKYPGYAHAAITFGSQELCDGTAWSKVVADDITTVCPSPNYIVIDQTLPGSGPAQLGFIPSQGNRNLVITFTKEYGWPVHIDNISVKFKSSFGNP